MKRLLVQVLDPAGNAVVLEIAPMFRGHQAREYGNAAGLNAEVVIAATIFTSANLQDHETAPLRSVLRGELLQDQNTVGETFQLRIVFRAAVIQEQGGAFPSGEILFQGQDLPPVTQR
jgi:hypothetical protein